MSFFYSIPSLNFLPTSLELTLYMGTVLPFFVFSFDDRVERAHRRECSPRRDGRDSPQGNSLSNDLGVHPNADCQSDCRIRVTHCLSRSHGNLSGIVGGLALAVQIFSCSTLLRIANRLLNRHHFLAGVSPRAWNVVDSK